MRLLIAITIITTLYGCGRTESKIKALLDSAEVNIDNPAKMKPFLDSAENLGATTKEYYTLRGLSVGWTDAELSLKYYNQLVESYPSDTMGYFYRGQAYLDLKEWTKAEIDYTTAINMNQLSKRRLGGCYYNRAVAREELGKRREATEDIIKSIELYPTNALAYCKLGEFAAYKDDFTTACELWRKSFELGFKYPDKYIKKYCQ